MHGFRCAQKIADEEAAEQREEAGHGEARAVARNGVKGEEDAGEDERGAEVLLQVKEHERHAYADEHGHAVFERRDIDEGDSQALFAQFAQHGPAFGEVAGDEENEQNFDGFDGLKGAEVDAGVAAAGAGAEEDQRDRQGDCAEQRYPEVDRSQSIWLATSMTRQPPATPSA